MVTYCRGLFNLTIVKVLKIKQFGNMAFPAYTKLGLNTFPNSYHVVAPRTILKI